MHLLSRAQQLLKITFTLSAKTFVDLSSLFRFRRRGSIPLHPGSTPNSTRMFVQRNRELTSPALLGSSLIAFEMVLVYSAQKRINGLQLLRPLVRVAQRNTIEDVIISCAIYPHSNGACALSDVGKSQVHG